ncbi:hypothetical protein COM88_11725 [Bacillus cereus]|nr:hypothetical protein COM88_11725 [Bacillus cereus]PGQ69950.1 hypothetical protein COA26_21130 [Bacillus cereus]
MKDLLPPFAALSCWHIKKENGQTTLFLFYMLFFIFNDKKTNLVLIRIHRFVLLHGSNDMFNYHYYNGFYKYFQLGLTSY